MKWRCTICDPACNLEVAGDEGVIPDTCPFDEEEPEWEYVAARKAPAKKKAKRAKAKNVEHENNHLDRLLF